MSHSFLFLLLPNENDSVNFPFYPQSISLYLCSTNRLYLLQHLSYSCFDNLQLYSFLFLYVIIQFIQLEEIISNNQFNVLSCIYFLFASFTCFLFLYNEDNKINISNFIENLQSIIWHILEQWVFASLILLFPQFLPKK